MTLLALIVAAPAMAQDVDLAWQARLADADGTPINGPHTLTLRLYDALEGGAAQFTASIGAVSFADGYVHATLADVPTAILGDTQWIEVSVDGTALSPRSPLHAVPVAAHALTAALADEATHADNADHALIADRAAVADSGSVDTARKLLHVDFVPSENLLPNWDFTVPSAWVDPPDTTLAHLPGYPGLIGPPYAGYTSPQAQIHSSRVAGTGCYEWARSVAVPIDPTTAYEFSVWVFSYDNLMNNYLGFFAFDASGTRIVGSWDNPYFKTSEADPATWVRWSGLMVPTYLAASNGQASVQFAETNGVDWAWPANAVSAEIRFGGCYSTNTGLRSYFALPMIKQLP